VLDGMQRLMPGAQVKPVVVASAGLPAMPPSEPSHTAADGAATETKKEGTP
jgi:hypothetical protein